MTEKATSLSHPIYLDWLFDNDSPLQGNVGLTIAPGKVCPGASVFWERDLDTDLNELRRAGITGVACLLETGEMESMGVADLPGKVSQAGMDFFHFPVVDGGAPDSLEETHTFVSRLADHLKTGARFALHCRAGLGRTGTIAACLLLNLGLCKKADEAIEWVRKKRSRSAVETSFQEAFVDDYLNFLRQK